MIPSSELMTHMLDGDVVVDDENVDREEIIIAELPREESHDDVRGGSNLESEQTVTNEENEEQFGRGKRAKIPSIKLRDYVTNTMQTSKSPSLVLPHHNINRRYSMLLLITLTIKNSHCSIASFLQP